MDMLTVDEILAAGFKFIPAEFIVVVRHKVAHYIDNRFLVHNSFQINKVCVFNASNNRLEIQGHRHCEGHHRPPYIEYYTPAAEWRAYAGAMTFHLTSEVQLWRFMKAFNYPLPIDK
ncbi:hypothetical protein [Spirosoma lituiforme]